LDCRASDSHHQHDRILPFLLTYDGGVAKWGNYFWLIVGGDSNSDPDIAVVDFSTAFSVSDDFGADVAVTNHKQHNALALRQRFQLG